MLHRARSFWLDEAGGVDDASVTPLTGDLDVDVAVVGGGYTGMWTAWHAAERGARVAVLEADLCGHGPSGRNGGFAEDLWLNLASLRERFGDAGAVAVARASEETVAAIGGWCSEQGVDAWYRRAGQLVVSTAPAQDAAGSAAVAAARELGVADRVVAVSRDEVQARCASPVFRGGVIAPGNATVQPARLALGLRDRLKARGVAIHERTRVSAVAAGRGELVLTTAAGHETRDGRGGRVSARHVVLAAGGALASFAPLRGRLTVASSHIVLTEPVPDVVEALGWTGGECITDGRRLLHYFRTTPDGRIAFGWAGGRLAAGARLRGRIDVDPDVAAAAHRHLLRTFPVLAGREITHAWGGPIDISPARIPSIGSLDGGRVHYAFGYTGNGVGPTHLAGRILAALATETDDPVAQLPLVGARYGRVPPEPLRWLGGSLVLAAMKREEDAQEAGGRAGPVTQFLAGLPERLGITVGR